MVNKRITSRFHFSVEHGLLLLILTAGFWVRLDFWRAGVFHIDEYISMLAAQMVSLKGLPILPSGLLYEQGLPMSYLAGAMIRLAGFGIEICRWPTVLIGLLSITAYYRLGRNLSGSATVGLLAAAFTALDAANIEWSVRVRMYTLANLGLLLMLAFTLKSLFSPQKQVYRYCLLAATAITLFNHSASLAILPPLILAALAISPLTGWSWLKQRQTWLQAGLVILLIAGVVALRGAGYATRTSTPETASTALSVPAAAMQFFGGFIGAAADWTGLEKITRFFKEVPTCYLLLPACWGLVTALYRLWRKKTSPADIAILFLSLFTVLVVLEMGLAVDSSWRKSRYLFILNLPAYALVAAIGWQRFVAAVTGYAQKFVPAPRYAPALISVAVLVGLLWQPMARVVKSTGTGDYNTAFEFVQKERQPGDVVMTVHPSAAYLFLGQPAEFYANQETTKVITTEDTSEEGDGVLDRYTGSAVVDTVEAFNTVLANNAIGKRVWFVCDVSRLFGRFEPLFTQQIFSQMNHVKQFGTVHVFLSESFPRPIPAQPSVPLEANFNNVLRLTGYNLDLKMLAPDGTLPLHLYWQPVGPHPGAMKVFVQVRNSAGQTIAQADHILFEPLFTDKETVEAWQDLREANDLLRYTAMIPMPIPLPEEPLAVYVGLYHPDTFERLPLLNDSSGENAAVIPFP